jgi:HK97 family phage prohead protease
MHYQRWYRHGDADKMSRAGVNSPGWQGDGIGYHAAHARAALAYFSKPANQRFYTASQVATIMAAIKRACRRFGITVAGDTARSAGRLETETRATELLVECRGVNDDGLKRIGGLAAVFGRQSRLLPGGFHEIVSPQAFSKSENDGWLGVSAKFEHRDILGTTRGRTLRLEVTPAGLDYTVDVVPSAIGEHAHALAMRGDLASSFAFQTIDDGFELGGDGIPVRHLESVRLIDVSAVSDPAYLDSTCAMRSLARHMDAPYADVAAYAETGRLSAFFTRSDRDRPLSRWMVGTRERNASMTMTGLQARQYMLGKRWPAQQRRPMSGAQAHLHMLARRPADPIAPRGRGRDPLQAKLRLRRERMASGW